MILIALIFSICATAIISYLILKAPVSRVTYEYSIDELVIYEDTDVGVDVHDSGIQGSLTEALKALGTYATSYDFKSISDMISSHNDRKIRNAALSTVKTMRMVNGIIRDYHELDILMMVYNRFKVLGFDKTPLVEELADAKGKCLVGRVTRIVQSLECAGDTIKIKSVDLYKDEITNAFLTIRRKFLLRQPEEIQAGYEDGSVDIVDTMRAYIDRKLRKKYCMLADGLYRSLTHELFNNL